MNASLHEVAFLAVAAVATMTHDVPSISGQDSPSKGAKAHVRMGTVQANGITIAYESYGEDARETILLIQGLGVQLTGWPRELIEDLVKRGYHVIAFDNRDI